MLLAQMLVALEIRLFQLVAITFDLSFGKKNKRPFLLVTKLLMKMYAMQR